MELAVGAPFLATRTKDNERGSVLRKDIQGLRAVAVAAVVGFHYFPSAVPGGYVGVDVFFVISGFLITGNMVRERNRSGHVSLPRFYARRIRRLLPPALATTWATVIAAACVVAPVRLVSVMTDAAWVTAYVGNVRFAQATGGYFAATPASPVLQFWSLSVEEQFYLFWPVLFALVVFVSRHRPLRAIGVALVAFVSVASLIASIRITQSNPISAYLSLGTRAWEFALGGLLAMWMSHERLRLVRLGDVAGLGGMAALVASVLTFSLRTNFPGVAALLPTVGTALVIWGGEHRHGPVQRTLSVGAAQALGEASYSVYLWHWPVLILGIELIGGSLAARVCLLMLSGALAAVSYTVLEKRSRRIGLHWSTTRYIATGLGASIITCLSLIVMAHLVPTAGHSSATPPSEGNASATLDAGVITLTVQDPIVVPGSVPRNAEPPLVDLAGDLAVVFTNGCYGEGVHVCEGGDPNGNVRIVLAGDSHAGQWWPAVNEAGRRNGWKIYMVGKNGCPLADVDVSFLDTSDPWPDCADWQGNAVAAIVDLHPDVIIYANHAQGYSEKKSLRENFADKWSAGVSSTLQRLSSSSTVVMFGQSPLLKDDPAECLSDHLGDVSACSTDLKDAGDQKIRAMMRAIANENRVLYFEPSTMLCTNKCPMMDHNYVMFHDFAHLSGSYSESLAVKVGAVLKAALSAGRGR